MNVLTFLITAEQPLLLTSLQGDPNSSVSFSYIPGSVIRGALIGRYREQNNGQFSLDNDEIQRLFFDGRTRYLNAYLYAQHDVDDDYERTLPLPHALGKKKHDTYDANKQLSGRDRSHAAYTANEQIVALSGDTCWRTPDGITHIYTVDRHVNIHNLRDRPRGRGFERVRGSADEANESAQVGALFRYDAIAPYQTFQAVVLCEDANDLDKIEKLLKPERLWLGGSRSAGYGEVLVSESSKLTDWHEVGIAPAQRQAQGELHVTLLSDLIARNADGQYQATFPVTQLTKELGVSTLQLIPERSFRTTAQHGGFNRTWGLPLPQTLALAAGSVLVFRFTEALTLTKVVALEQHGLGERRVEGFGRLACNWRLSSSIPVIHEAEGLPYLLREAAIPQKMQSTLSEDSNALLRLMADRVLRQQMNQYLIELVQRNRIKGDISSSQLTRLRLVARQAMQDNNPQLLQQFTSTLPKNARDQFAAAKVGDAQIPLITWLGGVIEPSHQNWMQFKSFTFVGTQLTNDEYMSLVHEYALRLIIGVARQATKEARS